MIGRVHRLHIDSWLTSGFAKTRCAPVDETRERFFTHRDVAMLELILEVGPKRASVHGVPSFVFGRLADVTDGWRNKKEWSQASWNFSGGAAVLEFVVMWSRRHPPPYIECPTRPWFQNRTCGCELMPAEQYSLQPGKI